MKLEEFINKIRIIAEKNPEVLVLETDTEEPAQICEPEFELLNGQILICAGKRIKYRYE